MNKHKEHILEMIYRIVGIEFLDLSYGDSKYILGKNYSNKSRYENAKYIVKNNLWDKVKDDL